MIFTSLLLCVVWCWCRRARAARASSARASSRGAASSRMLSPRWITSASGGQRRYGGTTTPPRRPACMPVPCGMPVASETTSAALALCQCRSPGRQAAAAVMRRRLRQHRRWLWLQQTAAGRRCGPRRQAAAAAVVVQRAPAAVAHPPRLPLLPSRLSMSSARPPSCGTCSISTTCSRACSRGPVRSSCAASS